MNKRGLISLVSLALTVGFILCVAASTVAKAANQTSFDNDFLISRAIVLANFAPDEISPTPEIRYLMPGEQAASEMQFNHSQKIINIFDPKFGLGGIQAIFVAPKYTVQDGEQALTFSSFKKTVGDILKENGIVLANEDQIDPPVEQSPLANKILITRVSVAQIDEFQTLPYQTKTIDDPTLERGTKVVEQTGKEGRKKLTYQVRRENGVEVSRALINQTIETASQDKIIKNGTKIVVLSTLTGEASWTNGVTAMRNYSRGTTIRVTNLTNGKSVVTTVGGWGPQEWTGRILDLDRADFGAIADIGSGTANVLVEEIKN